VRRLAGVLLALGMPAMVSAQSRCFVATVDEDRACTFDAPRWVGELTTLSANGLIGGLTAGIAQRMRGGSFRDGFTRGAFGGAVTWAGKRVASERFAAAGLLGRTIAAGGASVSRNASIGAGSLDRLIVPIGPVWLDVSPSTRRVRGRVDVAALAWLVYAIAEPELSIDAAETLSAGAPVFRTDGKLLSFGNDSVHAAGVTNAGVILLAGVPAFGDVFERRAIAHERIHVLQEDQLAILWTDPAIAWGAEKLPAGNVANRFIAWNLGTEVLRTFGHAFPEHGDRPWEMESIFFAR
jgi:hypothetical protein